MSLLGIWPGGGVVCPSLAAKERRAVFLRISGLELPATSQHVAGLVAMGVLMRIFSFAMTILLLLVSAPAFADCTSPAGPESMTRYDFTAHTLNVCTGTSWVALPGSSGAAQWSSGTGGTIYYNGGNVGIGTASTGYRLDVSGNANVSGEVSTAVVTTSGATNAIVVNDRTASGYAAFYRAGGVNYLYDATYGNVIGFNSAGQVAIPGQLSVSGPAYFSNVPFDGSNYYMCFDATTGRLKFGQSCNQSDERLKTDIRALEPVLAGIMTLKAVRYDWKDETTARRDGPQIGLIAQNVEKAFPEFVATGDSGNKSLDYARMTSVLVKAVQELKVENDALARRIGALEAAPR